jgi:hypothetical protein
MTKRDKFNVIVPKKAYTLIGFTWQLNRSGHPVVATKYVQDETDYSDVAMDWTINKYHEALKLGHYVIYERDFSHKTDFTHLHFWCVECSPKFGTLKRIEYAPHSVGYATEFDSDKKVCYECCAVRDKAYMKEHGEIALYLSDDGAMSSARVGNWAGSMNYKVIRYSRSKHNIAGVRYDVWFRDDDGALWWGVNYGHNSQLTRCRRIKRQRII